MYHLTHHSGHTVITVSPFPTMKGSYASKTNCLNRVKFIPAQMPLSTEYFYILFEHNSHFSTSSTQDTSFKKKCFLGETCSFHINASLSYLSSTPPSNAFMLKRLHLKILHLCNCCSLCSPVL